VTSSLRRFVLLAALALVAAACRPYFPGGSTLEIEPAAGTTVQILWNTAYDAEYPDVDHLVNEYQIHVDGLIIDTVAADVASCTVVGLGSGTSYLIEVTAESTSGEKSSEVGAGLGTLSASYTTPAGSDPGGTKSCDPDVDSDGDRIPDRAETDTGIFIDKTDTGTDPGDADTDGDGIDDGDEVLGTVNGLPLPQLGANPLKKNLFIEVDWMDDTQQCGSHSHRPTTAAIDRIVLAFADSPVTNPDATTGIDLIIDYGQGGFTSGGTIIDDLITPVGSINNGVNGAEFAAIKAANFHPAREGYFNYAVHMHRYNTNSSSSGQAELPGDDLIVSLQCFEGTNNTSNTLMHELGHNLDLRHGGFENTNYKPNYNSVLNYRFQFPGVDHDASEGGSTCDAVGDQELDYSTGSRLALDELALIESLGVCGTPAIDWNNNLLIDGTPVVADINNGDGIFQALSDNNDWANIDFGGVNDRDGFALEAPEVVDEQPVPTEFQN
jgi:hypothetical protein